MKLCQNISDPIPSDQIKRSYGSVYVHDDDEMESSKIRWRNVIHDLNQDIVTDLRRAVTRRNLYAQTFQTVCEWAQRGTPKKYTMVIRAVTHLKSRYT